MKSVNISNLDCIYLVGDNDHWASIQTIIPNVRRVDKANGLSAYHTAAALSDTERFILIDSNSIPDKEFFKETLEFLDDINESTILQWRSRNHVNGVVTGNGGLISCTREVVNNMTTEFSHDPLYQLMHDCYSTTYCNGSAFQSWAAGFQAGVELCLNRGTRRTITEFLDELPQQDLDQLSIWHNIGRDAEHGIWSIAGSRMGTYMTMITPQWDYHAIENIVELEKLWDTVKDGIPEMLVGRVAEDLATQLKLPMLSVLGPESAFFKQHYTTNQHNRGIMDVI